MALLAKSCQNCCATSATKHLNIWYTSDGSCVWIQGNGSDLEKNPSFGSELHKTKKNFLKLPFSCILTIKVWLQSSEL